MNVLQEVSGEKAVQYQPDPLYRRLQALRESLEDRTRDDLIEIRATLQEEIEEWRAEYETKPQQDFERKQPAPRPPTKPVHYGRRQAAGRDHCRLRLVEDAIKHYSEPVRLRCPSDQPGHGGDVSPVVSRRS